MLFEENKNSAENNIKNEEVDSDNVEESLCKSELQKLKESFLRLNADFENYKKRINKEKSDWILFSEEKMLLDLLPVIDDFDRAFLNYKKGANSEIDTFFQGFELIYKLFQKFLDKYEVKPINDVSEFNPDLHEAIAQMEAADKKTNQIISIAQKGYIFKNNKVLRPAKVVVAK